jgi:hypothetical protein
MSLNIEASWSRPIRLRPVMYGTIYECENPEQIPTDSGVYIFGREHGDAAAPLYIGKALNLRRRIDQQLNSVRLMTGIREAQIGTRFLIYCTPQLKRGQKAIRDFELLQKQGTKTPNHTIRFQGNRTSEDLAPRRMRVAV